MEKTFVTHKLDQEIKKKKKLFQLNNKKIQ